MKKKNNIFLVGPSGAGKSTIGQLLAKKLGWEFYDSDKVLEARSGVSISWIFEVEGEPAFRQREAKVIEELTDQDNIVLATGGGAILLPENRRFLSQRGVVLYFHAEVETLTKRVTRHRDHRPLLQVENLKERVAALVKQRTELYREIADISVITENKEIENLVSEIILAIEQYQND